MLDKLEPRHKLIDIALHSDYKSIDMFLGIAFDRCMKVTEYQVKYEGFFINIFAHMLIENVCNQTKDVLLQLAIPQVL